LTFWLKFAFCFIYFLALFVSEKLLNVPYQYQVSVKNFNYFIYKLEVAISRLRVTDAPPGICSLQGKVKRVSR
jgi:hypothetical protein